MFDAPEYKTVTVLDSSKKTYNGSYCRTISHNGVKKKREKRKKRNTINLKNTLNTTQNTLKLTLFPPDAAATLGGLPEREIRC